MGTTTTDRLPTPMVLSCPRENGLAYEYAMALRSALYLLTDEQLCHVTVRSRYRPYGKSWLLLSKCEAEAAERWNRRLETGKQPTEWLRCILSGAMAVPGERD
jgi:hypothetical protein